MAITYNKLIIDVNGKIDNIVTAKQSDTNSRFLDVVLLDGGLPIDLTGQGVKIYFRKPDQTEVFTEGEVTDAAAGRCQFELTSQTLAAYGDLKAEISIWDGDTQVLTTQTFTITVFEMLRSDESVESTNEFGALVTLFQNIQQSLDLMHAMVENFGEAGEVADAYGVDTFWEMLEVLATKTEEAISYDVSGKIGETNDTASSSTTSGSVFAKLNYVANKMVSVYSWCSVIGGEAVFKTVGASSFKVPFGGFIQIIACAGGGGGGCGNWGYGGGGGGGGSCVFIEKEFFADQIIYFTIGAGGSGGAATVDGTGASGSPTIIDGVITLAGGGGGKYASGGASETGAGGTAGGSGGGVGGNGKSKTDGEDGLIGKGGTYGGGGGSFGNGGNGATNWGVVGLDGIYGGGGGGGGGGKELSNSLPYGGGGKGGDGIIIFRWGAFRR